MDNFYEQLVSTYKTPLYKITNGAVYVLGGLAVLALGSGRLLTFIICGLLAAGLYFLKRNLYVEYEYVFTNGEIDIDKIMEMSKRKRVLQFSIKEAELIAPEDSYYIKDFGNKPEKVVTCYPKTCDKRVYVVMITGGTERVQLRIAPDEEFLDLCFKYNPRALKKD